MWENWSEFLAPGFGPAQPAADIWDMNQWMRALSLTPSWKFQTEVSAGKAVEKVGLLWTVSENYKLVYSPAHLLKTLNVAFHVIQQFHVWIYTQENWIQGLEEKGVFAHLSSQEHYSKNWKAEAAQASMDG